jgi:hypothetical protein
MSSTQSRTLPGIASIPAALKAQADCPATMSMARHFPYWPRSLTALIAVSTESSPAAAFSGNQLRPGRYE